MTADFKFSFIDLFAGIGGFHLAMHSLGGQCVFASEIDVAARKTYEHHFKHISPDLFDTGMFNDDIRKVSPHDLPDFDVLCAGFPCQPFSQAGHKRGFADNHHSERGKLFFNIIDILAAKQPKAFFLENVRGIVKHDDGHTFKVIQDSILELGYSFHYQVVKASDYGLPQLRPRVFMIGFKNEATSPSTFSFPAPIPLQFTMSDVWGGHCSRDIGFTLRVGGRGSKINDRRNWDAYLVDGEVKKIMPEQARKMQGFPEDFVFPVANTQAMKQLGNSVAIDAVRLCAQSMIDHMRVLVMPEGRTLLTKNKGEWTELYVFLKLLHDKKLFLADEKLQMKNSMNYFRIHKVTTLNISESCYLDESDVVLIKHDSLAKEESVNVSQFLNSDVLAHLAQVIRQGKRTFHMPEIDLIQDKLGISIIKGGTSSQKADIVLDIESYALRKVDEGFGIKSYLGSKPTLLNASGNTNFIFEVKGLPIEAIDKVNAIQTRQKLKDRLKAIGDLGGQLSFVNVEKETMAYNLSLVDSMMPRLLASMLLEFFVCRTSSVKMNLHNVFHAGEQFETDLNALQVKVKRLLLSVLLGFFAGKKWDGKYIAHGTIVVKEDGEQLAFHMTDKDALEAYLFEHIKFDTPSTTRHRYGYLILERDGKIYFKLNLQLRF